MRKQVRGGEQRSTREIKRDSTVVAEVRSDGFMNVLSGVGTRLDPRQANVFAADIDLTQETLESMFRCGGLAKRIVSAVPKLVTKDPWKLEGDTDNAGWDYLERFKFNAQLRRAGMWGRLYGGAIIVLGIMDGRRMFQPVNENAIRSIEFARVYDRWSVSGSSEDWNSDPESPRYGEREWYTVFPRGSIQNAGQFRVHYSRVIEMPGEETTELQRVRNWGWGDSILQAVYKDIERFLTGLDDSSATIKDFVQGVLKVKDLTTLLSTPTGERVVTKRLNMLDLSRHILNTMVIGDGEEYSKASSSIGGIPELLDRLMGAVSMSAEIPQTVLFGRAPAGLSATGDNDTRMYYDTASATWREVYSPAIKRVLALAVMAKDGPKEIKGPFVVTHANLWKPTEAETAATRKTNAETDAIYIDNNVIDPREVRESRFGGEAYSSETVLNNDFEPANDPDDGEDPDGSEGQKRAAKKAAALAAP